MAMSFQTGVTTAANKTAGSSQALAVPTTLTADKLYVIWIACDNVNTTDTSASPVTSITDTKGNTYTQAVAFTNGQGAAGSGIAGSIWYSRLGTTLTTGDSVTVNFSQSITAKAIQTTLFNTTAGKIMQVDGTATLATDGADPGSITCNGTVNQEHLWLRLSAGENNVATHTADADFNGTAFDVASSGGGAGTNAACLAEYRIATETNAPACDPSGTSADWASMMCGLIEVDPPSWTPSDAFGRAGFFGV